MNLLQYWIHHHKLRIPVLMTFVATVLLVVLIYSVRFTYAQSAVAPSKPLPFGTETDVSALTNISINIQRSDDLVHTSKPQISPNGRYAAVTIVPLGTETAHLAQTYLYHLATKTVHATFFGHSPRWFKDGTLLQIESMDRRVTYHPIADAVQEYSLGDDHDKAVFETATEPTIPTETKGVLGDLTEMQYPISIRVAHHPSNGCRSVPEWQVDIIPFEEYVARVVPAETPAWWPVDALAAQAVAARTYAWRQILVGRADYDVTDWANFQMMCDDRHPHSDRAVAMTTGQYLASHNDRMAQPISAMYSAENGHPTLTNPNVGYLQSVPDLFAIGKLRFGHGYGLSQWGAYRRANAGHTYRQILGHYYSNVYIQNRVDSDLPRGALLRKATGNVATDRMLLWPMIPPNIEARIVITANRGLTTAFAISRPAAIVWQPSTPLDEETKLTATLSISGEIQDVATWQIDRQPPPSPALALPALISTTALTFALAADLNIPLISAGWHWEGEELLHTINSGITVADDKAINGFAWMADPTRHDAGVWYGPYTHQLPIGHSYRALFWLRATVPLTAITPAIPIARLDVTDRAGQEILGIHDLRVNDFRNSQTYMPIAVDFHLFTETTGIEFRVVWMGETPLAFDRVDLWRLPDTMQKKSQSEPKTNSFVANFDWAISPNETMISLITRAMDSAGNLSASRVYTAAVADLMAPTIGPISGVPMWITNKEVRLTTTVTDTRSGVDSTSAVLKLTGKGLTGAAPLTIPAVVTTTDHASSSAQVAATVTDLVDGIYTATLRVRDHAGNFAERGYPLRSDSLLPRIITTTTGTPQNQWFLVPFTITVSAIDNGSGIDRLFYRYGRMQPFDVTTTFTATHSEPIAVTFNQAGIYTTTTWAIDQAGNRSRTVGQSFALDIAAPTLTLSQTVINSTTVHVGWQARDDSGSISHLELELQSGQQSWQPIPLQTDMFNNGMVSITIAPEQPTYLRARGWDHAGRMGAWEEMELWIATDWLFLPIVQR